MAAAYRVVDVECPEGCEAPISVSFALAAKFEDGTFTLETHIVGSPVADHVAECHPDLID